MFQFDLPASELEAVSWDHPGIPFKGQIKAPDRKFNILGSLAKPFCNDLLLFYETSLEQSISLLVAEFLLRTSLKRSRSKLTLNSQVKLNFPKDRLALLLAIQLSSNLPQSSRHISRFFFTGPRYSDPSRKRCRAKDR